MKDFDLNSLLPTLTSTGLRLLGGILVLGALCQCGEHEGAG